MVPRADKDDLLRLRRFTTSSFRLVFKLTRNVFTVSRFRFKFLILFLDLSELV